MALVDLGVGLVEPGERIDTDFLDADFFLEAARLDLRGAGVALGGDTLISANVNDFFVDFGPFLMEERSEDGVWEAGVTETDAEVDGVMASGEVSMMPLNLNRFLVGVFLEDLGVEDLLA